MPSSGVETVTKTPKRRGGGSDKAEEGSNSDHDFFWTYTEEPHRTRRLAIIKAHPEVQLKPPHLYKPLSVCAVANHLPPLISQVTKLCGPEPLTKYVVAGVVGLQIFLAWYLSETPFFSWKFWIIAYVFGATSNQNLFLAIHEISHNLAFRSPLGNRLLAMVANLPIGIPYSASFRVCTWLLSLLPLGLVQANL